MIPQRFKRTEQVEELSDEDVIEIVPETRSGTYALSRPREAQRPLSPPPEVVPSFDTISDGAVTDVSEVIGELARLSDVSRIPTLRGTVEWSELTPSEAWLISVTGSKMTISAIMAISPFGEEETLRVLAKLIGLRRLTLR